MADRAPAHPAQPRARGWASLQRSADDRIVAGVAGGVAGAAGLNATVVRVAFVALTFAAGLGLLLYVVAWLLLPSEGAVESLGGAAVRRRQDVRPVVAVGMIVLGGLLLVRQARVFWFSDGLVWPVVVAAMGLYVIWRQ